MVRLLPWLFVIDVSDQVLSEYELARSLRLSVSARRHFPALIGDAGFRQLMCALLVSLTLHCFVLWKFGSFAAEYEKVAPPPLMVRLLAPTPVAAVAADFLRDSEPRLIPSMDAVVAPRTEISNLDMRSRQRTEAQKPAQDASRPNKVAIAPRVNSATPPAPEVEKTAAAPLEKPLQADRAPGIPLPGVTTPVKYAEIEFSMYSGEGKQPIGNVRHSFKSEVTDTGEYYSLSIARAQEGQTSDSPDEWKMSVGGRISESGLAARRYRVQGAGAARLFALREVPQAALKTELRGATADGLLDRQSLLYHFSRQPPSFKGGGLWLADNLAQIYFEYQVAGIEEIQLPGIGAVRTTRVVLFHPKGGGSPSNSGWRRIIDICPCA